MKTFVRNMTIAAMSIVGGFDLWGIALLGVIGMRGLTEGVY